MVSPAISNLAIVLIMMQVSKRIDFEDPDILLAVRVGYVLSNLLIFGLYFYTKHVIRKKNDLTTLKYVKTSSNPMESSKNEELVTTTIRDYDLEQVDTAIRGCFSGIAMMAFMHLYMKYANPLLIQSIVPLKGALEQNIVKIHIFGKPPVGDLKRPFKVASMFGGAGASDNVKTDKKSIAEAEKSGTGGAKEE